MTIAVGILDSGLDADLAPRASSAFRLGADGTVETAAAAPDAIGHGNVLARHILAAAPSATLINAQVFSERLASAPKTIAAGLDWLVAERARVINLSFGVREDRAVLRHACARALDAGAILVAAAPARGALPYPAAYPGVLSVQGDARCAPGQVSRLGDPLPEFGTLARSLVALPEGSLFGGASWAASHFTGLVAAYLTAHPEGDLAQVRDHFDRIATYRGPERRAQ
ncbi:MAG: S8 family serine peptidase [Pseudomonadota bacterium]